MYMLYSEPIVCVSVYVMQIGLRYYLGQNKVIIHRITVLHLPVLKRYSSGTHEVAVFHMSHPVSSLATL